MQRFIFFTGKGGVGKTTLSCATAVRLVSQEQKRVLLVCTDPASNLSDVLEMNVGPEIAEHPKMNGLFTINIDPKFSAESYKKQVLSDAQNSGHADSLEEIKGKLQGACTVEIASFDHFSRFVSGELDDSGFDHIIFDTAPTGHTLRLLELPGAWDTYLENNPRGGASIRPETNMVENKARYAKVIATLRDANATQFNLVARSDQNTLVEAARTSVELQKMGYANQKLFVNGMFNPMDASDRLANEMHQNSLANLDSLPEQIKKIPKELVPLLPYNVLGIQKLKSVFDTQIRSEILQEKLQESITQVEGIQEIDALIPTIAQKDTGLVLAMGKGGVGKTLVASYTALRLAQAGKKVTLTTTDPAAHIHNFLQCVEDLPPTLTVQKIDPKVETDHYRNKTFEQKKKGLSEKEQEELWADLQTPCNQEISVFVAFSKTLRLAKRQIVVMDTAPTGHTLLLLDTTGTYHKEIINSSNFNLDGLTTPYMSLQDPDFAKVVLVSLPEKTPINEALQLKKDLEVAGIAPSAWIINQSFMHLEVTDPLLRYKQQNEHKLISELKNNISTSLFKIDFTTAKDVLKTMK